MEDRILLRVGRKSYALKRLCFLADFLNLVEIESLKEVSVKIGLSNQALIYNFKRDDINISHVYNILNAYGYTIRFEYVDNNLDNQTSIKEDTQTITRKNGNLESNLKNITYINSRLFCIHYAITRFGLSRAEIYTKVGICRQVFMKRLKDDDCPISMLTDIADHFGWTLKIDIYKKEGEEKA